MKDKTKIKEKRGKKIMRKRTAWVVNLINVGVLTTLVAKNCNPLYGAIACAAAALTILVATIPEALTPGIVYNDDDVD